MNAEMREIKFRAWDKVKKRWIKDDITIAFDGLVRILSIDGPSKLVANKDVVIEFYTGFKDKNGKEIYEGDIFRASIQNPALSIVKWDGEKARFRLWEIPEERWSDTTISYASKNFEIIGNVHQEQGND